MKELKSKDYEKFGEAFWKFYTENGFGNKSKSDIDAEIYDIICRLSFVDDTQSALLIGRDLKATETSIKKYKEDRFFKHKIDDEKLKEQVKKIFKNNQSKLNNGKITFTVSNAAAKLYIEELLHKSDKNYDYTNNPSNISMSVETFVYIAEKIGCDLDKGLKNIMENEQVKNLMGNNYITIQNIFNEKQKATSDKLVEILSSVGQISGLLQFVLPLL